MIQVTEAFQTAVTAPYREWAAQVAFGVFDVTARDDATAQADDSQTFTDPATTLDSLVSASGFGTCEKGQFAVDGSMRLFPEDPSEFDWGWWSEQLSSEDGTFDKSPVMEYSFTLPHSSIGLTITLENAVEELLVEFFTGDTALASQTFTALPPGRNELYIPVEDYALTRLTFQKVRPFQFVKLLEIGFGIEYVYTDKMLIDLDVLEEVDLTSNTISSNAMNVTLNNLDQRFNMFNPQNEVRFLQERQQLQVSVGLKVGYAYEMVPLGRFYLDDWNSPTANTTRLSGADLISQLNSLWYKSQMYEEEAAGEILTRLFEDIGLYDLQGNPLFYIHPNVAEIILSGYLEPMSYRDALQRIAFACRAIVKVDRHGKLLIYRATEETRNAIIIDRYTIYKSIPVTGTFVTGQSPILPVTVGPVANPLVIDGSLSQAPKASLGRYYNQVNLEQYRWRLKEEPEELFSGEITGDSVILFQAFPAANVEVSGTYTEAEVYACAVVLRGAQGQITVTGTILEPMSHMVTARLKDAAVTARPESLDVTGVTLISRNETAQTVSNWLLDALQNRITQTFKWWMNPVLEASDFCKIETQFGELRESQVRKMHFVYKGGLGGDSEVVG